MAMFFLSRRRHAGWSGRSAFRGLAALFTSASMVIVVRSWPRTRPLFVFVMLLLFRRAFVARVLMGVISGRRVITSVLLLTVFLVLIITTYRWSWSGGRAGLIRSVLSVSVLPLSTSFFIHFFLEAVNDGFKFVLVGFFAVVQANHTIATGFDIIFFYIQYIKPWRVLGQRYIQFPGR